MLYRSSIGAIVVLALALPGGDARAWDDANGLLMPARKDQPPPDLRYFNPARK
jgi:hypothetical protein